MSESLHKASLEKKGEEAVIEEALLYNEPKRWYNTGVKVFGKQLLPYNHATVQVIVVAFVCFMCPGMFNALNGLGGNGLPAEYTSTAANCNVALYATFSVFGFFGGSFVNRLGAKWVIAFGGIGYALYSGAYLCFDHTQNKGFVIAAGAILGVCAGLLWAGQGVIVLSYATEDLKGTYVTIFWAIFNVGAVIGSIVPLAQNVHNDHAGGVTDGTYAGFLALMLFGAILALALLPTDKVQKADGSRVIVKKNPTWWSEFFAMYKALISNPEIILLFPLFFSSNWFYTYQFNEFNAALFNVRTRSLNSLLYWAAQIFGALGWGYILDWKFTSRRIRARVYHLILFVITMALWGGGLKVEQRATREEFLAGTIPLWDWTDRGYIGPMFLYIFYGMYDAIYQTYCYWLMGTLSNSSRKLAIYAGFYKGLQSAGAVVVWRLDAIGLPFKNVFASTWALCVGGLLIALPMVWFKVLDHADLVADAEFTGETVANTDIGDNVGDTTPRNVPYKEAAEAVAVA